MTLPAPRARANLYLNQDDFEAASDGFRSALCQLDAIDSNDAPIARVNLGVTEVRRWNTSGDGNLSEARVELARAAHALARTGWHAPRALACAALIAIAAIEGRREDWAQWESGVLPGLAALNLPVGNRMVEIAREAASRLGWTEETEACDGILAELPS